MKKLIYYPGFEAEDINWLKFAMLYIDVLKPIIPYSGDSFLSDTFRQIRSETDLFQIHRPGYEEGMRASNDALEVVERILEHPERFAPLRFLTNASTRWKKPQTHTYTVFEDKYTDSWEAFCLQNKLASKTLNGIKVSTDLGYIYMALLAQAIADSRGISVITDKPRFDLLSILSRKVDPPTSEKIELARSVLELKLPANLKNIDIDEIIKQRRKDGYKDRLKAFHTELDKFYDSMEQGQTATDFVKLFDKIYKDFSDEIVKLGIGTTTFGLGVWNLVNSPDINSSVYLKEMLGGTSLIVGSIIGIRSTWNNTQTKRYCRKYLASLGRIKPAYSA
jgi:hypothetical protein